MESRQASANAILAAAERAASTYGESSFLQERFSETGSSLPHPDEHKGFSSRSSGSGGGRSSRRFGGRGRSNDDANSSDIAPDRVRAEALKVLEMADDISSPHALRRTNSESSKQKKRLPAALSGIDFRSSARTKRTFEDKRWVVDDSDEDDEDDLVDIVAMQDRTSSRQEREKQSGSWSSRYNVDDRLMALTGHRSTKEIIDSMDKQEQNRLRTSANNLFRSSPHSVDQEAEPQRPMFFGKGFKFQAKHIFNKKPDEPTSRKEINLQAHKTVWMDVDLQANGRSLPPPPDLEKRAYGPNTLKMLRKRRRLCGAVIAAIVLVVIFASVFGSGAHKPRSSGSTAVFGDTNTVRFHVTADVPWSLPDEKKLGKDLQALPGNTEFMVHLGNIQDSAVTLCSQESYVDASMVLKRSPVPVLTLPGPHDWNNCPDPTVTLKDWNFYLGKMENHFPQNLGIERQLGHDQNFAFVRKQVLFLGLHLISGRVNDRDEWSVRHAKTVEWVERQISLHKAKVRALVIMGNARPSHQQQDVFGEILDDIDAFRKPVLYLHANDGTTEGVEHYRPFRGASNLIAVQIERGGLAPPTSVAVGTGDNPFLVL